MVNPAAGIFTNQAAKESGRYPRKKFRCRKMNYDRICRADFIYNRLELL